MSNFDKNLSEIFGIAPPPEKIKPTGSDVIEVIDNDTPVTPIESSLESHLESDYIESRNTLKQLVKKGNDAIDHLLAIASETEHPRAFEVVATLIKNTTEANEKLLTIQKQIRDLKGLKAANQTNLNVDKAIFVGSTTELSKLIKKNDQ